MSGPLCCATVRDLTPDLALGSLAGEERAVLLDHLSECPACEGLVAELAGVVDSLLLLTPEADPPPGFESAVLERIAATERPIPLAGRRQPGRTRLGLAIAGVAAAVALIAGAAGVATYLARHSRTEYAVVPSPTSGMLTGALVGPSGQHWGHAFVYQGQVSFVMVTMNWEVPDGEYTVELDRSNGPGTTLAGLRLTGGQGSLGEAVTDAGHITEVRVVDRNGHTICVAAIRA